MNGEVLREAARRLGLGERVGVATVVATRGSTPQKASARLVVTAAGEVQGTLGGGAVEAEVIRETRQRLDGNGPLVREYPLSTGTDEWGLACGGTMVVLIEALGPEARGWLQAALGALEGEPLAVVTVLDGAWAGARVVVREQSLEGGLEDPALLAEAEALGRRALATEQPELAAVGTVRLWAEPFGPEPHLVVVGAGHIGKALAALGRLLGVRVTVLDDRPQFANPERFPEADRVVAAPVGAALAACRLTARSAVVVAMRTHDLDYEAVRAAVETPARYVGLVGSRRKAILVAERLAQEGVAPDRIRALRSPVGLDLGARTPAEIALSILAEWLMLRQGGTGVPLRLDDALLAKALRRAALAGEAAN